MKFVIDLIKILLITGFFALNICHFTIAQNSVKKDLKSSKTEKLRKNSNLEEIKESAVTNSEKTTLVEDETISKFISKDIKSLMFKDDQIANINKAIHALKNNTTLLYSSELGLYEPSALSQEEEVEAEDNKNQEWGYIYLASILYFDDKNWAIWLNDKKITFDSNSKGNEMFVRRINGNNATIAWRMGLTKWRILSGSNENELPKNYSGDKSEIIIDFTLKPNQTFILKSQKIVEGKMQSLIDEAEEIIK